MRILVYPHDLGIGGSQINAIELAERMKGRGHEVVVFGTPGPLVDRIHGLGLEFVAAAEPGRRPDRSIVHQLGDLARDRHIDILHGYEWPPALECSMAARFRPEARAVATVMSMAVAPFIPRTMPLVVGTHQIEAAERALGRQRVFTIEPPVDLKANSPTIEVGTAQFRSDWGLDATATNVVAVTRLAHEMKLEGLLSAMQGLVTLNELHKVNLLIVGDGPARSEVERGARAANEAIGRLAVRLTGELGDPRPAYAASDIQLAMGSSALRALAFGKPTVVQGERGFWRLLDERSVDYFLWAGWYGVGQSCSSGTSQFLAAIQPLIADPDARNRLGRFGYGVAHKYFSLDRAAGLQEAIYRAALESPRNRQPLELARCIGSFGRYKAGRLTQRVLSSAPRDDFNSRPVIANGPPPPSENAHDGRISTSVSGESKEIDGSGGSEHVAIVVVTYNSEAHLPGFLDSLPLGCGDLDYEVVVADNGSKDDSVKIARGFNKAPCTVVEIGTNLGYAAGLNRGAAGCRTTPTAILVVNPDVRLGQGSVPALIQGLRQPGTGVAVPQPFDGRGRPVRSIRRTPTIARAFGDAFLGARRAGRYPRWGELVTDPAEYVREHRVAWAEGSAQLISAECWNDCGPWDESFFLYSEETEFDLRAGDRGYDVRFVPDAHIVHHKGQSEVDPRLWAILATNRVRLFKLRNGSLWAVPFWLAMVLREGSRALLGSSTSRRALASLLNPRRMREWPTAAWTR